MNRFIIVDGLPYLYAGGKAYAVRWDNAGFTVGAEIELKSAPGATYSDISIKAKCNSLDSIGAEPEEKPDEVQAEAEPEEKPKRTRKKKNAE